MFASIMKRLRRLIRDESGPTAIEYAVMLALIIIVCLVSIRVLGQNANSTFDAAGDALELNGKVDGNVDGNGQI
jgi:pilus assembly protein Flp/PilA